MQYYAWRIVEERVVGVVLTPHADPNRADPSIPPGVVPELLYRFEAATWEEAMAIHHLRQGFKPYQPGPAAECPTCQAVVYESGVCWRCPL